MRITLRTAEAITSLSDYLSRCGCIVARVDARTIEASAPPRSLNADLGDLELEAYLHVWGELNPSAELTVSRAESAAS